jgi:competence protein ComEA
MKKLLVAIATVFAFSVPAWAAVDINNASQAELESLNGIGPKKAQDIVDYRKKNGPFKSVDELEKVPGIGKKTVDGMKKDITVGNPKAAAAGKPEKAVKETKDKTKTVGNEKAAESGKVAEEKLVKEAKPAKEMADKPAGSKK